MFAHCFDSKTLLDSLFLEVKLVAGDLNARRRELESEGKGNMNGTSVYHFLQDYPHVKPLGSTDATPILGGRLDYACLMNDQGACEPDLLSDHFSLVITLPEGKRT